MNTKRCMDCHKLQRVENRVCSRCGRAFEARKAREGRSWPSFISHFSLPPASPHHVGHYSGLHPEDQPYLSNAFIMPEHLREEEEMQDEEPLQEEPKHIVLPPAHNTPVLSNAPDLSPTPTYREIPPRRSRQSLPPTRVLSRDHDTQGQGVASQPSSQPLMRGSLPITQWPEEEKDSFAPLDDDEPSSAVSRPPLVLKDLPSFMREALRTRRKPSRLMSALLVASGFFFLLAISITVLILMGDRPVRGQPLPTITPRIPHTSTVQVNPSMPPQLQLSDTQAVFSSAAPGIVSSQTITLMNSGGGSVVWHATTDRSWLTASTKSGTFANTESIQITVNRNGITPGTYTGHVKFIQQNQENNPYILNVTMAVAPLPAQLNVSTTDLTYSATQSQAPDSQIITISNTGQLPLNWDATTSSPWLTLSLYHGRIPAGIDQSITVNVASQTLPLGTYSASISFSGDAYATVGVSLTVSKPANVAVSPSSLTFNTQNTSQSISLQNNGDTSVDWTIASSTIDEGHWLSTTLSGGTLAAGASVTITVRADPTQVAPGFYQGMLTVSFGGQTKQVSIIFVVAAAPTTPAPTSTSTAGT